MKKIFSIAILTASSLCAIAGTDSDKVILTIDKTPVTLGEFEYLYNKNNSQQAKSQSAEEYMDLFTLYKLKVADAVAQGIDTTASFREEYGNYLRELANPYFYDKAKFDEYVRKAYSNSNREIEVSHIMFNPPQDGNLSALMAQMDSIRAEIKAGNATFDEMAVKYSVDPGARRSGRGYMGFINANSGYPYEFVSAAFATPADEISEPVNSGYGYHLIKTHSIRPRKKDLLVEHILKLTQGKSPEQALHQKAAIDSIYSLLASGNADFATVARRESEDPGSAPNGGKLDWFSSGRMVPEFEEVSYELPVGGLSKPFKTSYGYHIVHKLAERDTLPFEEMRPAMEQVVRGSSMMYGLIQQRINDLKERFGERRDTTIFRKIAEETNARGGFNADTRAFFMKDRRPVVSYNNGDVITVGDVVSQLGSLGDTSGEVFSVQLQTLFNGSIATDKLYSLEIDRLAKEDPDFRNLANEYHDGILLYEISNRNVWGKGVEDRAGLNEYFNTHRQKYNTWKAPRYKGYIVFATSDSISQEAKKVLEGNNIPGDSTVRELRKIFGKEIRVERVLAEKGKNDIVDNIAFSGPRPQPKSKWVAWFPYEYKIIEQPEEATDVRGEVTSDYQAELEKQWVDKLRKQHKVRVNKGLLKKVK